MTIDELIDAMYAKEELEWDFYSDGPTFGTVRSISVDRGFPGFVFLHTDKGCGAGVGYQVRPEKVRRRGTGDR
jgi:hypothetical protein